MKPLKNIKKIQEIQEKIKNSSHPLDALDALDRFLYNKSLDERILYERIPTLDESILMTFLKKHYERIHLICTSYDASDFDLSERIKKTLMSLEKANDKPGEKGFEEFINIYKKTIYKKIIVGDTSNPLLSEIDLIEIFNYSFFEIKLFEKNLTSKEDVPTASLITLIDEILGTPRHFSIRNAVFTKYLFDKKHTDFKKICTLLYQKMTSPHSRFLKKQIKKIKGGLIKDPYLENIVVYLKYVKPSSIKNIREDIIRIIKSKNILFDELEPLFGGKSFFFARQYKDEEMINIFQLIEDCNISYAEKIGNKTIGSFLSQNLDPSLEIYSKFEQKILNQESNSEFNL